MKALKPGCWALAERVESDWQFFHFLPPSGVFYNIICVPPERETAEDTLQGAKVLCSIPAADSGRPSYYHSFGKTHSPHLHYHSLKTVYIYVTFTFILCYVTLHLCI